MSRRMDLKNIAYWVTVVSLALNILWMAMDAYDEFAHRANAPKAAWRALSAVLSLFALLFMLMHPPSASNAFDGPQSSGEAGNT
jgi:hypothetical protein